MTADSLSMVITGIEQQKRRPERVNVFLDGEFAFGLHKEIFAKFRLRKGDRLTQAQVERITEAEELNLAKQRAFLLLNYRMRTEKELRTRLLEKEFPPPVVDRVIDQFLSLGLVNDMEFARAFVRDRRLRKPTGRRRIRQELRLKGVSDDVINEVLDESVEPEDEQSTALEAAKQHMKRSSISRNRNERAKQQQRLAAFLTRRGFSWSTISPVLKEVFHTDVPPSQE